MVFRPVTAAAVTRPLNVIVGTSVSSTNPTSGAATSTNVGDVKNGPLAKAGSNLIALYLDYQSFNSSGGQGTFSSTHAARLQVVGNQVRVDIRGTTNVGSLAATLSSKGMHVESTDANTRTVEGLLPISQLPAVAQLSQVTTISPVFRPTLR